MLFTSWVKQCVTTAMFSVVLNGSWWVSFLATEGLGKEIPLSIFVFADHGSSHC